LDGNGAVIVTGATGFVGRYLVDHLVNAGEEVIATGRSRKYDTFFEDLGVPFLPLDVSNPDSYAVLPQGPVKAFIHLAALIPAAAHDVKSDVFLRTNTLGTFYALEYCRQNGIRKFLYTTTVSEGMQHMDMPIREEMGRRYALTGDYASYVISKVAAADYVEHYSQEYGIQGIILRLTGLLGYGRQEGFWADGVFHPNAFELFYRRAKAGQPLEIWGAHRARRDSLYVKDAVRAIHLAINSDHARGLYLIGSGIGRTNEEEALTFVRVFGTPDRPVSVVYQPEKAEKAKDYYFDIGKAKREFGWEPVFDYARTLVDYDAEVHSGRFKRQAGGPNSGGHVSPERSQQICPPNLDE
jgi:UDP-glucose 4-epimerase